jgi:ribosome-binding ATPase YchF (GTP1/OBG family)
MLTSHLLLKHKRSLLNTPTRAFSLATSCGIVGYPNIGKSTLFNALARTQMAQAKNYPFCTIDPNVAKVAVHDKQIRKLVKAA